MDAAEAVIPADESAGGLTGLEREILDFESQWWRQAGKKENAIRDAFGLSPIRYYQTLNSLLDKPAAIRANPLLVNRLRRARVSRRRVRTESHWGIDRHWGFEAR